MVGEERGVVDGGRPSPGQAPEIEIEVGSAGWDGIWCGKEKRGGEVAATVGGNGRERVRVPSGGC
jgi:hypothetical protein